MAAMNMISLKDRTFTSTVCTKVPDSGDRAPNYKQYDNERLKQAYDAVKENRMSVRKAALSYNVPKSTLNDRVSPFGSHSGPSHYLSDEEETQLVHFLCNAASLGYARTKKEVLVIVEELVSAKGRQIHVSNGWWESSAKDIRFFP